MHSLLDIFRRPDPPQPRHMSFGNVSIDGAPCSRFERRVYGPDRVGGYEFTGVTYRLVELSMDGSVSFRAELIRDGEVIRSDTRETTARQAGRVRRSCLATLEARATRLCRGIARVRLAEVRYA